MQPPPPGGQYPASPQPVPPPPKRRRTGLWILLGVAGLVVVCCGVIGLIIIINSGDDKSADKGGQGGQGGTPTKNPGVGEAVRDGKFEFVVKTVECGVTEVGTEFLGKQAQGQFCLVTLSVKNIGDEPQTLSDTDQKGIGTNGSEYSADSGAGLLANDTNSQVWVTEINPGNQVTGAIVYDLPKDVDLAKVELHDSAFSDGVMVDVK